MSLLHNRHVLQTVIICTLSCLCVALVVWAITLKRKLEERSLEVEKLSAALAEASQRLAAIEQEARPKTLLKMIDVLAAAGVPGLILLAAIAVSGFSGGAAITVALASLGGPAGMLGGIGILVTLGVVIAKFGLAEVSVGVIQKLLKQKSKAELLADIDLLPSFIPNPFRQKAKNMLEQRSN